MPDDYFLFSILFINAPLSYELIGMNFENGRVQKLNSAFISYRYLIRAKLYFKLVQ